MLFFFNSHSNPRIDTQDQMPKDTWPGIAKAGNETWTLKLLLLPVFFFFFPFTYNLLVMLLYIITFVDFSVAHDITQIF